MVADGHVCKLEERVDYRSGALRWSLLRKEICHCQAVVAPRKAGGQTCYRGDNAEMNEDLWFTDDSTPLVNRKNWDRAKLDLHLNRTFCCTFDFYIV